MAKSPKRGKVAQLPKADTRPEPGPRNREAMAEATKAYMSRPMRVSVRYGIEPGPKVVAGSPHTDEKGHVLQLTSTFGTTSIDFMTRELGRLEGATRERFEERGESATGVNAALAMVGAINPQDELEGALAVQMAGCHALTMEMLSRAKTTERADHIELYGNMAVKLQRTFTAQIEALARMRGKGQQTVRVEHVTVQPGAQAIVGDVHHHGVGRGGAAKQSKEQPHGTGESEECAALPGPNSAGNGVPIPGHAERAMSPARRKVARGAKG